MTWATLAILCTLVFVLGVSIDKLFLSKYRETHNSRLYNWWFKIEELKVPELVPSMAKRALLYLEKKVTAKTKFGRALKYFRISLIFSFAAYSIYLFRFIQDESYGGWIFEEHAKTNEILLFFGTRVLQYLFYAIINFPFDYLTIRITQKALNIVSTKTSGIGIIAILVDVVFALLLLSIVTGITMGIGDANLDGIIVFSIHFVEIIVRAFVWGLIGVRTGPDEVLLSGLMAATIVLPTLIYLTGIVLAMLSKLCLKLFRRSLLYFIELSLDDPDPKKTPIFSLVAVMFNIIAVIAKTVSYFLPNLN